MLFNSFSFLVFFVVVGVSYYALPHRFRWILLLLASCYFYMAFIPAYILILAYLVLIDYSMGILIERAEGRKRKIFLIVSIIANVGTLFFFKYFNFFNANVAQIASLLHWHYPLWTLAIALPLGLSFHTFQSLAYVIEVYKKRYPAERHLGIYALYVMFFPQLVAGPIERPQQLLPQLHADHEFNEPTVADGLRIMLWGFFKKVVVADNMGTLVDMVYGNLHAANGVALVIAMVGFAVQLYSDFSGYSDIARGSAKVFGVTLINNFHTPYFSTSVAEFWRNWHISLSNWFRDYFYQPLALAWARISSVGIYLALIVTFVVIGLWHGAAWTYVLFGTTFGIYMAIGFYTKRRRESIARITGLSRLPRLRAALQTIVTFGFVCIGFVFFRATSVRDAFYILLHAGTGWAAALSKTFWIAMANNLSQAGLIRSQLVSLILASLTVIFGERIAARTNLVAKLGGYPRWVRWSGYYILIIWILAFGYYQQRTFIYFQF